MPDRYLFQIILYATRSLTLCDAVRVFDRRLALLVGNTELARVQYGRQDAPYRVQLAVRELQRVFHARQQFVEVLHVGLGLLPLVRAIGRQVPVPLVLVQLVPIENTVRARRLHEVVEHVEILLPAVPAKRKPYNHIITFRTSCK